MGKHFWMKNLDDERRDHQPGCMWGLVHVLNYHHWQSNVRKMIHYRKHEGRTHDKCDWSPERSVHRRDACETEKLLDEKESLQVSTKRSRANKKRSLRSRIKALISEEISRENENRRDKRGSSSSFKPSLQRTYSIHHLESIDNGLGKIRTDLKHPIIFLPRNVENDSSQSYDTTQTKTAGDMQSPKDAAKLDPKEGHDVLEIFKVDKELLLKHLQDSDESIANFSRSAFGLNTKPRFSKSRSFPVDELAQRRKVKPMKLESKQKEVWSFTRDGRFQTANQPLRSDDSGLRSGEVASDESNGISGQDVVKKEDKQRNNEAINGTDRVGEKSDENDVGKLIDRRSSSLKESLDRYARLFENSFGKDVKLSSSKSLKLTNEYRHAPPYFRRIRSLSNVDSYYSNVRFELLGDENDPSGNDLVVIAKRSSSGLENSEEEKIGSLVINDQENVALNANMQIKEDYESLRLHTRDDDGEKVDDLKEEADNSSDISYNEFQDQGFDLDADICLQDADICLQETESQAVELQISQDVDRRSRVHELSSSTDNNDEISDKITNFEHDGSRKKTNSDLDYVRYLLDQSGIATDATELTWHSSDQPLSPQLFEEVEAGWPHDRDQLTGWPDFCGCWHHQMLFDHVNEVLVEVYDLSLPYYPKALSSSCHVRPFPIGNRIVEDVCTSVGALLDMKPEEKESLDCIIARDLGRDNSWMNLQLESEFVALDVEDMIFNELLQEVVFS